MFLPLIFNLIFYNFILSRVPCTEQDTKDTCTHTQQTLNSKARKFWTWREGREEFDQIQVEIRFGKLLYQQVFHIIDMPTKFGRLVSLVYKRGFSTSTSVQKGASEQGVKSLNLCSAINQALHIALDSDPRLVSLFIYFMKIYLVRVWEVIRVILILHSKMYAQILV